MAIDRELNLRQSWRGTQGQGPRLFVATSLSLLPLLPIIVLLIWGNPFMDPIFGSVKIGHSLFMLTYFVCTALAVTVLSQAFRHCTGWRPATGAGPEA